MALFREVQKLFKIAPNLALTTAGLVGHAQSLSRTLNAETTLYQLKRGHSMTVKGAATLTANILLGRPYWVQLLIVGVDDSGPSVYSIDGAGGSIPDVYCATGSGSPYMYGVLEDGFREGMNKNDAIKLIKSIYKMFISTDASMVEINPLILTKENRIVCLDAKINFDDNALFKHKEISDLRDLNEEDSTEIEASKHDLAYIKLDGSIGCMVNGAGLAMATMDIIKLYGEEPANFLDVGGGASKEKVSAAFKIILSDKNVKGILINIFGGIMRCDVLAQGVVDAAKEININVPLVVRLAGTNFKEGKEILDNSGLKLISAENLDDAAKKIVEAIK